MNATVEKGLIMNHQTSNSLRRLASLAALGAAVFLSGCAVTPLDGYAVGAPVVSTSAHYYEYSSVPYYYPAPYYGTVHVAPRFVTVPRPPARFSHRAGPPPRRPGGRAPGPGAHRPDRPRPPSAVAPRPPQGAGHVRPPSRGAQHHPPRANPPRAQPPRSLPRGSGYVDSNGHSLR